ncbi:hypothetical protein GJV06_02750 [Enterobacteriaceae bacterium RIT691]|nr:hypothetical protein [Enterobacteriaceae bacterium RIT691]
MQQFTFITSADEKTLYRYQISQSGSVFYVTISLMAHDKEAEPLGTKVLINITHHEVIQECLSHCRRHGQYLATRQRRALLAGVRDWLVCSVAVLTFIRLMIAKN